MNTISADKYCAIRVQLYHETKYIILDKNDLGNWGVFIRTGKRNTIEDPNLNCVM